MEDLELRKKLILARIEMKRTRMRSVLDEADALANSLQALASAALRYWPAAAGLALPALWLRLNRDVRLAGGLRRFLPAAQIGLRLFRTFKSRA